MCCSREYEYRVKVEMGIFIEHLESTLVLMLWIRFIYTDFIPVQFDQIWISFVLVKF